jgi:hypothetical protein
MTVAFLVMAHQHPAHLARLVERLRGPGCRIYLHVDRKSDRAPFLAALPKGAAEILSVQESVKIYWGGFSVVRGVFALLRRAVADDPATERFCLLSGADYPLVKRDSLIAGLARTGQHLRIDRRLSMSGETPHDSFITRYRMIDGGPLKLRSDRFPRLRGAVNSVLNGIKRRPLEGVDLYHGSTWWCLDRRAVGYVLDFVERRPEVTRWLAHARCPDEILFASILKNGPLAPEITQDYVAGRPAGAHPNHHGVHYIDWTQGNPRLPRTLILGDLDQILDSGAVLGRKFDPVRSAALLDALDRLA